MPESLTMPGRSTMGRTNVYRRAVVRDLDLGELLPKRLRTAETETIATPISYHMVIGYSVHGVVSGFVTAAIPAAIAAMPQAPALVHELDFAAAERSLRQLAAAKNIDLDAILSDAGRHFTKDSVEPFADRLTMDEFNRLIDDC